MRGTHKLHRTENAPVLYPFDLPCSRQPFDTGFIVYPENNMEGTFISLEIRAFSPVFARGVWQSLPAVADTGFHDLPPGSQLCGDGG
jgi:hypothetical protein